jgi:hypothetical protein
MILGVRSAALAAAFALQVSSIGLAEQGYGTTPEECNGVSRYIVGGPNGNPDVKNFNSVMVYTGGTSGGLAFTLMGYSNHEILKTRFPHQGTPGEFQMKIEIPASSMRVPPLPNEAYPGIFLVSQWDQFAGNWSSRMAGYPQILFTKYEIDETRWNDGVHMCAGLIEGVFEGIGPANELIRVEFSAPFLTNKFPK